MTAQTLDLATVPLSGQVLIEASAGTGKTYTISSLVLRRIIALENPLDIKQILVVTFTKAATSELRARIRSRLKQAERVLAGEDCDDAILLELLAPVMVDAELLKTAQKRLKTAVLQMDEACIFTIHSFCQQILQQHAFESGSYFDLQLETDEAELQQQIAVEVWRQNFYGAPEPLVVWGAQTYGSPQGLLAKLQPLLKREADVYRLQVLEPQQLSDYKQLLSREYLALQRQWQSRKAEIQELLETSDKLKRTSYKLASIGEKLAVFDGYFADEAQMLSLPAGFDYLCQHKISKAKNKNGELLDPFFSACEALEQQLKQFQQQMLVSLLQQFKSRQKDKKTTVATIGFRRFVKELAACSVATSGRYTRRQDSPAISAGDDR